MLLGAFQEFLARQLPVLRCYDAVFLTLSDGRTALVDTPSSSCRLPVAPAVVHLSRSPSSSTMASLITIVRNSAQD